MSEGQEADFFALLSEKQELTTRDGKPYYRVTFRDARREVGFPIWSDSPLAESCRREWTPGQFYKMRAVLRQSNYGPQLEIKKIRPVEDGDREGRLRSADVPAGVAVRPGRDVRRADEHRRVADRERAAAAAGGAISSSRIASSCCCWPAAKRNHHAFVSGYLEHVLNVTRTCCHLADKYAELYSDLEPPLNKDVVVAGAVLHDIGKLRELAVGAGRGRLHGRPAA